MLTSNMPEYKHEWYLRNREEVKARSRAWYHNNKERASAKVSEWQARNPELVREIKHASRQRNPEAHRRYQAARRARENETFVEIVDPLIVLELHDGICGICGEDVDPFNFHVDHIVPLAKKGEHSYANSQPAHPKCNWQKGPR